MNRIGVIALFLLLGIATSLAIAWYTAASYLSYAILDRGAWPRVYREMGVLFYRDVPLPEHIDESTPLGVWRVFEKFDAPGWSKRSRTRHEITPRYMELATGWPLVALHCVVEGDGYFNQTLDMKSSGTIEGLIELNLRSAKYFDLTRLPARPIILNLLLDAVFWGAAWYFAFSLLSSWRLARWMLRKKRSCCPWCNYNLTHTPTDRCPECGKTAKKRPHFFTMPKRTPAFVLLAIFFLAEVGFLVMFTSEREALEIHYAAFQGDLEKVKSEVARGVDIESKVLDLGYGDPNPKYAKNTPLIMAAMGGHNDVVEILLEAGADVHAQGKYQHWTALFWAIERGNASLVKTLLEHGSDPYGQLNMIIVESAFKIAVDGGHLDVLDVLLESGADPDMSYVLWDQILFTYVGRRDLEMIRKLAERGAKPGFKSIQLVMNRLDRELFDELIKLGGDLTAKGKHGTTLLCVLPGGWVQPSELEGDTTALYMWKKIIEAGVGVNDQMKLSSSPLMTAVQSKRKPLIRLLLDHGADVTYLGSNGSALSYAYMTEQTDLFHEFLERGARPDFYTMHLVVDTADREMVDFLLDRGGNLLDRGASGITLLFFGYNYYGPPSKFLFDETIMKRILEAGVDVNAVDTLGKTALFYAAQRDLVESVRFLLANGADPTIASKFKKTAIYQARRESKLILQKALDDLQPPNDSEH